MPLPLPHKIERTRNRSSRAFVRDGTIVIRLAKNLSTHEERRHIETLLRRIGKHLVKEQKRSLIDPFRPLLHGAQELHLEIAEGGSYHFMLSPGNRTRIRNTRDGWHITVGPKLQGKTLHRMFWKLLAEREEPILDARVRELNARTLRVHHTKTKLCYATSLWGSCASDGRIMLNTALLFTGEELLNYVVVHELAHRIHKNHSKAFWNTVARAMPEYQETRKKLRNFRIVRL